MTPKHSPAEAAPVPADAEQLVSDLDAILHAQRSSGGPEVSQDAPGKALPHVLIVEDDDECRGSVKQILEHNAYHVSEACNGREALESIRERRPDLIVVDFNMPEMNGYELIQEIKSVLELRAIPIIILTGSRNREHMRDITLDVTEFLEKPVSSSGILDAIGRGLGVIAGPAKPNGQAKASPGKENNAQEADKDEPVSLPQPSVSVDIGPVDAALLDMIASDEKNQAETQEELGLEALANDSPVISKLNQILIKAVKLQASDIHIEPQEDGIKVRVRLDGSLRLLCILPIALHARLAARVKVMSNLSITERRLPQDGRFRANIDGAKTEFRVSTMPSTYGEKIVLRILGQSKLNSDLRLLKMNERNLHCVERALKSPHGIIFVTGPTGSGKTTTLYTMISSLNTPDVNTVTAEDPVEYRLAGITQVQVMPAIGFTFGTVLRTFLRQDPDVILVGEVRDLETAEIAMRAAITGHLVLSTLHTNSAPATISRLTQMGLPPYLVAASVKMVIAQRLIKLLCPACKIPVALSEEDARILTKEEIGSMKTVHRSVGCDQCHQTGYRGRKPIFEVMPITTPAMRSLILASHSVDELTGLAQKEGMVTLRQAAIEAVGDGSTSLQEAIKIILAD